MRTNAGGGCCSALDGNDVIIEKLLSLAVLVDSRNNHDLTSLMITAVNGRLDAFDFLIAQIRL